MARKHRKGGQLVDVIEERAKAGETYRENGARFRNQDFWPCYLFNFLAPILSRISPQISG